jgi:YgiT-type zinc finger domain-containing protein
MKRVGCTTCGGTLSWQTLTYVYNRGDTVAIVTEANGDICSQCGEQFLYPETVDRIQELVERGQPAETRAVPAYHLASLP